MKSWLRLVIISGKSMVKNAQTSKNDLLICNLKLRYGNFEEDSEDLFLNKMRTYIN